MFDQPVETRLVNVALRTDSPAHFKRQFLFQVTNARIVNTFFHGKFDLVFSILTHLSKSFFAISVFPTLKCACPRAQVDIVAAFQKLYYSKFWILNQFHIFWQKSTKLPRFSFQKNCIIFRISWISTYVHVPDKWIAWVITFPHPHRRSWTVVDSIILCTQQLMA